MGMFSILWVFSHDESGVLIMFMVAYIRGKLLSFMGILFMGICFMGKILRGPHKQPKQPKQGNKVYFHHCFVRLVWLGYRARLCWASKTYMLAR